MAFALKVDPGTLSRVESGTRIPILANLYRLCTAYGTTPYRALLPTLDDRSYDDGQRSKFRA
jgi:transcriptional regulator with XRE-family HTH domain